MLHTSHIELSRSALQNNIRFLRKIIGPKVIFSSVIKGNAYGHGIEQFVSLAESLGIRHFSLYGADEAHRALKSRTQKSRIMIMGAIDDDELAWAIENEISFYVFDHERLVSSQEAAQKVGKPARIHLEVETGLNRMGLREPDLDRAVEYIRQYSDFFVVEGLCTHFAGAESVNNYLRVQNQIRAYRQMSEKLEAADFKIQIRHTACSAAALTFPDTMHDMVRIGIAHYGFWPSKETQMHYYLQHNLVEKPGLTDPLKRVMNWKSKVMGVKTVNPGEFIGYGTSCLTTRHQTVALIAVGYAHGFPRVLSNLGHVLVHGRRASVVGMVNMNMMTVDVTDIPGVKRGDEVVLIGRQNKHQITVAAFSDLTRFLNYEVLVRLPSEIPRIVVD
jgi:alanine racemase